MKKFVNLSEKEHQLLMDRHGYCIVEVFAPTDQEDARGITPDGRIFGGWRLNGGGSGPDSERLGVYQLRSLRWYGVDADRQEAAAA